MSLINKKQNTLTQTIGHSPICIKSTCLICKRFDNNENHIKYNEYYLCKSCFIIKDIHKILWWIHIYIHRQRLNIQNN